MKEKQNLNSTGRVRLRQGGYTLLLIWAMLLICLSLPQEQIAKAKTWFKADEERLIETAVPGRKMDQRGSRPL